MEFGTFLKNKRTEAGLSIRQLSVYSKVSAPYLSQIERGERGIPSPEIIKKLAKPLKVTYEELMQVAGYLDKSSMQGDEISEKQLFNENVKELIRLFDALPEERKRNVIKGVEMMLKDSKEHTDT